MSERPTVHLVWIDAGLRTSSTSPTGDSRARVRRAHCYSTAAVPRPFDLGVTLEGDPAAELPGHGRYSYFFPDEVVPIGADA